METKQPTTLRRFMPLIIFTALVVLLGIGLTLNPRMVPSPFIGKPAPAFELPLLLQQGNFSEEDFKGHVTLFNVWASWCFACRQEHEVVKYLSSNGVRIIGMNYKDESDDAKAWLVRLGNPYQAIATDLDGKVGIDWGVYGAPETFLVDQDGIIRHKVIGPLSSVENMQDLLEVSTEQGFDALSGVLKTIIKKMEK
ncbi:MAG: DsbE family thiol:disulfide interchange protein [Proteobacteria bacterium]|nr:DsbE family thiol:disulfide interchange protein [Pseudomonadota bacterium]